MTLDKKVAVFRFFQDIFKVKIILRDSEKVVLPFHSPRKIELNKNLHRDKRGTTSFHCLQATFDVQDSFFRVRVT